MYKDGAVVGLARHTHGWGQEGGEAIAVNSKYVFIGQYIHNEGGGLKDPATWPPKGKIWFGVSRRLRADVSRPRPFAGGKGGKGDTLKGCFLPVIEIAEKVKADLSGLAADAERLYASCPTEGRIKVFDAESMRLVAEWPVERPGPLALGGDGSVWVLQTGEGRHAARLLSLSRDGKRTGREITFPQGAVPTAIALGANGRMLVADAGPDQQIRIFENVDLRASAGRDLRRKGGIYSGTPGAVGPLRFNDPRGVGVDSAGNVYVVSDGQSGGGGTVLESYKPDGALNWRLLGLEFVDMADADPASDADVYTKEERFRVDYSQTTGREARYEGYTIHRFKYPEDPRLHIWSAGAWVRRIQGRRFLFVNEMNAGPLQVYRFDPDHEGEIAVPSGLFAPRRLETKTKDGWPFSQPKSGEWIWRDADGDGRFDPDEYQTNGGKNAPDAQGWWVDDAGNVWRAAETEGIRMFPIRGLDRQGNPIWDYDAMRIFPKPPELDRVKRLRYDAGRDVMYLGGVTAEHGNQHWKPMGPVICRYDAWSKGAPGCGGGSSRPTPRVPKGTHRVSPWASTWPATICSFPTPAPRKRTASAPATSRSFGPTTAAAWDSSNPRRTSAKSASRTSASASAPIAATTASTSSSWKTTTRPKS